MIQPNMDKIKLVLLIIQLHLKKIHNAEVKCVVNAI